jgi:hypothetical protein
VAKTGRKGFGPELRIIERYSELSDIYFKFLKAKLESDNDEEKWKAVQVLKGAFEKMIPQKLDGEFANRNFNTDIECSPGEHEAVKEAILKSIQDSGSQK